MISLAVKTSVEATKFTLPPAGTSALSTPSTKKLRAISTFWTLEVVISYWLPAVIPDMVLLICIQDPPSTRPYASLADVDQVEPVELAVITQFGLAVGSLKLGLGITPHPAMTGAADEVGMGEADELELETSDVIELGISDDVELGRSDELELVISMDDELVSSAEDELLISAEDVIELEISDEVELGKSDELELVISIEEELVISAEDELVISDEDTLDDGISDDEVELEESEILELNVELEKFDVALEYCDEDVKLGASDTGKLDEEIVDDSDTEDDKVLDEDSDDRVGEAISVLEELS